MDTNAILALFGGLFAGWGIPTGAGQGMLTMIEAFLGGINFVINLFGKLTGGGLFG